VLRVDNAFWTDGVKKWCEDEKIDLLPCIPYTHDRTGTVERGHRPVQERVVKVLDKPHLTENLLHLHIIM
jgi:hypothetical protein